jgi:hypothetical protein
MNKLLLIFIILISVTYLSQINLSFGMEEKIYNTDEKKCMDGDKVLIEHVGVTYKPIHPIRIECSNKIENEIVRLGNDFEGLGGTGCIVSYDYDTFEKVINTLKSFPGESLEIAKTKHYRCAFIFTIYRENKMVQKLVFAEEPARNIFIFLCKLLMNEDQNAYNQFREIVAHLSPV